jgi:hypothetical protein
MVVIGNFRNRPDLRKMPRRPIRHAANLLVDEKGTLRPCWIVDISDVGARLMLLSDYELPERFVLLLTETGKARRDCRVVWRDGLILGVEFQKKSR